jgi:hypothetical protein
MMKYGLLLDLGGAPPTPHVVQVDGRNLRITNTTPLPLEDCDISLEDAKRYDKDTGCPLKLVKLAAEKVPTETNTADEALEGDDE